MIRPSRPVNKMLKIDNELFQQILLIFKRIVPQTSIFFLATYLL